MRPHSIHYLYAERNLQQKQHSLQEKSHAFHLSTTIDAISKAHEEALHQLTSKLNHVESKSRTLSEELDRKVAQTVSTETTVAKLKDEIEILTSERKAVAETQFRERNEHRAHVESLEKSISCLRVDVMNVKEEKVRLQTDLMTKVLQLESVVKNMEVNQETSKRERKSLLDEITAAEEREQQLVLKMEGALQIS